MTMTKYEQALIQHNPILAHFSYEHLPEDLQLISRIFHDAAFDLVNAIQQGSAERTTALRKLLEAKDCAVRAARESNGGSPAPQTGTVAS